MPIDIIIPYIDPVSVAYFIVGIACIYVGVVLISLRAIEAVIFGIVFLGTGIFLGLLAFNIVRVIFI